MSTKIEQLIDEIEEYIDNCKYQTFSNTKIIVDKDEIDELLRELRMKTPDEIKRYQKIISNKEAILNDAREKAEQLINQATIQTNELVSEHQVMQQAYAQANDIVQLATNQAQDILDNATLEANEMRMAAAQYTDNILAEIESALTTTAREYAERYDNLLVSLNQNLERVQANRAELQPAEDEPYVSDELQAMMDDVSLEENFEDEYDIE